MMQKYKAGDKVLIKAEIVVADEVNDRYILDLIGSEGTSIFVTEGELHSEKTYEQGLADAWKAAIRIASPYKADGGLNADEMLEIFGTTAISEVFRINTAKKAIEKIGAWENSSEIEVNDVVVRADGGLTGVVSLRKGALCYVNWKNGTNEIIGAGSLIKTGQTADITGLLAGIEER